MFLTNDRLLYINRGSKEVSIGISLTKGNSGTHDFRAVVAMTIASDALNT
jgi:hypothetical protein